MLHSLPDFCHSLHYPQPHWALLVLLAKWWVCVCSRPLWDSPTNSPVRLGVSPTATSTPMCVFNQRFEALFLCARALGCRVCFAPLPFFLVYLCENVGPWCLPATTLWGLLAAAWPGPFHSPPAAALLQVLYALPTCLDECFFFISLIVGLPYSSISVSSGCFLFLSCCCPSSGCARRHSVSTYTSILAGSPPFAHF